jgi:hypothetical protein
MAWFARTDIAWPLLLIQIVIYRCTVCYFPPFCPKLASRTCFRDHFAFKTTRSRFQNAFENAFENSLLRTRFPELAFENFFKNLNIYPEMDSFGDPRYFGAELWEKWIFGAELWQLHDFSFAALWQLQELLAELWQLNDFSLACGTMASYCHPFRSLQAYNIHLVLLFFNTMTRRSAQIIVNRWVKDSVETTRSHELM